MQNRQVTNDTVFVSATLPILYSGCDWSLFWISALVCVISCICVACIFPLPTSLYGMGAVGVVFVAIRWGLRSMAKQDPMMVPLYMRHIKWPAFLPAQGRMLTRRGRHPLLRRSN